jgi:DNA-binding transcriptional ArsR family regulator
MNICSDMTGIDPHALEGLTEIFRVLGDPTRLRILDALSRGELCVGDLAAQLGVTESAVSHQLRLLRSARIVRARRDGRMIFYTLDDTHVLTLFEQGLRHVQEAGHAPSKPTAGDGPASPQPTGEGGLVSAKPIGDEGRAAPRPTGGGGGAVSPHPTPGGGFAAPKPYGGGGR